MMKRSLTKSGSTVTSSTATFIPPYQPLSPLSGATKQASQESNSIYNIFQESKRNNKNSRNQSNSSSSNQIGQYSLLQKNNIIPSTSSQSNLGYNLSSQQTNNIQSISQSNSANTLNTPSILNSITKQSDNQVSQNQRLLMSAQKTSSLHSNNAFGNSNTISNNNNNHSSQQKSPASHQYRSQTQCTPTQQKTSSSIHQALNGISPKILLTGGSKSSVFHSHRPSLATQNPSQISNENVGTQKRRDSKTEISKKSSYNGEQSVSLNQQTQNYGVQQSIQGLQNFGNNYRSDSSNILKENNNIKNIHNNIINSIMQQHQQQQQILQTQQKQSKDSSSNLLDSQQKQLMYSKNLRINSCANLDTSNLSNTLNTSANYNLNSTTGKNYLSNNANTTYTSNVVTNNQIKNQNSQNENSNTLNSNFQQNQIPTDRSYLSIPRTPKSPSNLSVTNFNGSLSSKTNLQSIFNTTNQTQNTDIDIQHQTSIESNNLMNISSLSANTNANISAYNLTERGMTLSDQMSAKINKSIDENSNQDSTYQSNFFTKCSNHPDKKAKYIVYNYQPNNNLYCSKCAVQFSKEGYQTIHIQDLNSQQYQDKHSQQQQIQKQYSSNQPYDLQGIQQPTQDTASALSAPEGQNQAKLKEIELFLNSISSQGDKWQELNRALLIKKNDVNNFYERQQNRIEDQYKGFIEMINGLKEQTMQKLNSNREKSVLTYQNWEKETKESLTDFLNIKADIEMNTEKIVNLIQMDDFCRIMNSYKEKLAKMSSFFQNIGNECLDLVKFNNQAPSFDQFYPQIEQAFSIVNFSTTLVKKRVSEFMSTKKTQQSIQNNSMSLYLSTQSNFNKDQSPSPNLKSGRISGSMMENYNSTNLSTRGSLGNSQSQFQNFGNNSNKIYNGISQVNSHMDVIHEDDIADRSAKSSNNGLQYQQLASNNQSACNSPVKNESKKGQDHGKKDIYVSFGNNKEASLHTAIQQANYNNSQQQNMNSYAHQYSSGISIDHLQATPVQNIGVYCHQIKPLTDIIEQNINDEDEGKSQPNTPELKQIDDIPSKLTPSSQNYQSNHSLNNQKPFRNLFGREDEIKNNVKSPEINAMNYMNAPSIPQTNKFLSENKTFEKLTNVASTNDIIKSPNDLLKQSNQHSYGNSISASKYPSTTLAANDSQQNQNGSILNTNNSQSIPHKFGVQTGSAKSPRYSMYECEDNNHQTVNNLQFSMKKNNNQLDDYVQMLERQNTPITKDDKKLDYLSNHTNSYLDDNTYNYQQKNYYTQGQNLQTNTRVSIQNKSAANEKENINYMNQNIDENILINQQDDDEVIVTHEKQEDLDNPLFSSPGYKQ